MHLINIPDIYQSGIHEIETDNGLLIVFKVIVDVEHKTWRPDYNSEPQHELTDSYISATFKEAWIDEFKVELPSKVQYQLEEEIENEIKQTL